MNSEHKFLKELIDKNLVMFDFVISNPKATSTRFATFLDASEHYDLYEHETGVYSRSKPVESDEYYSVMIRSAAKIAIKDRVFAREFCKILDKSNISENQKTFLNVDIDLTRKEAKSKTPVGKPRNVLVKEMSDIALENVEEIKNVANSITFLVRNPNMQLASYVKHFEFPEKELFSEKKAWHYQHIGWDSMDKISRKLDEEKYNYSVIDTTLFRMFPEAHAEFMCDQIGIKKTPKIIDYMVNGNEKRIETYSKLKDPWVEDFSKMQNPIRPPDRKLGTLDDLGFGKKYAKKIALPTYSKLIASENSFVPQEALQAMRGNGDRTSLDATVVTLNAASYKFKDFPQKLIGEEFRKKVKNLYPQHKDSFKVIGKSIEGDVKTR